MRFGAVADDRPVAPARCEPLRDARRSRRAASSTCSIASGSSRSASQQVVHPVGVGVARELVGDREREQEPGRDLRVERLGRRDAHLHVATVGRVEHAVGLVDEVAVAPVDDREHRCAPGPGEVDGAVGVGGGAALADRDHERVGHVGDAGRSRRARWRAAPRPHERRRPSASRSAAARLCPATAAVPCPITSTRSDRPSRRRSRSCGRRASRGRARRRGCPSSLGTILPRSVLRNDAGASEISFSR